MIKVLKIIGKITIYVFALFGVAIAILTLLPAPAPFTLKSYLNDHGYDDSDDSDDSDDLDDIIDYGD